MIRKGVSTMIQIDDKIVSLDVIEKKFICDLQKCKGYCCVHGESGAPLEHEEVKLLDKLYPAIKPYLRKEGIQAIEEQGTSVMDPDKEMVTPLIHQMECAYAVFENGIAYCAIEKAFEEGKIVFQKPVSCHLYPVRVKTYKEFIAVNYDLWQICDPARKRGEELNMHVFQFVRKGIERKFGRNFFQKLKIAAKELSQSGKDVS